MHPYENRWWYVERPFPWLLITVYLTGGVVLAGVGALVAVLFTDIAAKKLCQ